jgi:hypothetical protein
MLLFSDLDETLLRPDERLCRRGRPVHVRDRALLHFGAQG